MRKIRDIQFGYVEWDSINDLTLEDLKSYWNRPNKIVIVKLAENNYLTFLVEDCEKPQVPGYPASGIEYFKSHQEAIDMIKKCLNNLNYTPKFQEFGYYSK